MGGLRWPLASDSSQEQELFPQGVRVVGKGEYRGLEFLEVDAKTIINKVPGPPRFGFQYTINAYRGCSHACSYCLAGDTPILMADLSTKPIAKLRVGDRIVGTRGEGSARRTTVTKVLDHWRTDRRAMHLKTTGPSVVASVDHRFLTRRGWRYVGSGRVSCPEELHPGDEMVTVNDDGNVSTEQVDVVGVEDLGITIPMYDITTGTGDFIADGVVSHNCFARPTHDYLGLDIAEDFDTKIVVKRNAVERARAETSPVKWGGDLIAMGTNTDPYQAAEGKYRLTRGLLEVMVERTNPVSILTKSSLALRDVDVLSDLAKVAKLRVDFSVGTVDEKVWRATEPGTPHPMRRLEAVAKLNAAGIRSGVLMGPVLPGLSDSPDQLHATVKAAVEAGAVSVGHVPLHLGPGVKAHFMDWIASNRPDLLPTYDDLYSGKGKQAATRYRTWLGRTIGDLHWELGGPEPMRPRSASVPEKQPAKKPKMANQLALDLG